MEDIKAVYEELLDGYNNWENEKDDKYKQVIKDDCHPCINWDEWDYQFYFDDEGNLYCLPNEGTECELDANISNDTKETVISIINNFLED